MSTERAGSIAARVRATMNGPMWHGPSVLEAIADCSAADARAHPIAGAHSIWELVLHIAVWAEIPLARMDGSPWSEPTLAEEFPPVPSPSAGDDAAWAAAQQRAITAYQQLANRAALLTPDQLTAKVVAQDYSVATMLRGVVEHGVYHAGQIVLLRRMRQQR